MASDILVQHLPNRPARSPDRAAPAPPHGGRFASAGPGAALSLEVQPSILAPLVGPGAAFRAVRCPRKQGRTLSAGKGEAYPRIRAALLTYWPGPGGWFGGAEAQTARRGGAYPRIRAVLLTYWPRPDGRFGGAEAQTARRGGPYPRIRSVLLTYWPGPGGRFAWTDARTARHGGAAYPRIRAAPLTYWPGPGGRVGR